MTAIKAKNGKTVVENVTDILRNFPETRNNDRLLMAYYWAAIDEIDFDGDMDEFLDGFKTATPPSSIQRARQMVNYEAIEDNFLPTDEKILKDRLHKAQVMKDKHERIRLLGDVK